ncbi:membrane protein [Sphaerisporangium melleum]|uniref:Membrane protein n=1 Tax=Sphaerisporangium melleum TaxID=321316 RepID=A0A917QT17_9ACTN|nr:M50 family metallopeptidase [Sphaerisporangium melleum]GGK67071.1 membrane protein [Sphaerisporangium melleum]GII68515.1 membrane protein [Sphaerisporangium melleum]
MQPHPAPWITALAALVALGVVLHPTSWHLSRGLITVAHEGGHALVALLTRRKLQGIRLHSDTSGVTLTRGRPRGPGMVFTAAAGYVAPSLLGLGAAWLTALGHITILLWTILLLLTGMLLMIRNVFGAVSLLTIGGAVFALSWFAPAEVQAIVAQIAAWFLLIGGVRPILELRAKRRRGRAPDSDADQLARLTPFPGGFFVFLFLLVSAAALVAGGYLLTPVEVLAFLRPTG